VAVVKRCLSERERRLLNAATQVSTLWALVMVGGAHYSTQGVDALEQLAKALEAYSPEEVTDE
jgi:hypothetical protein